MDDIIVPELQNVDTTLIIDPDTRTIDAGSDFLLGVETDNDAERVKFQCPKIVGDNLDLSQYHIYIHYQNAKGEKGKYLCEDIEDGGENITFSWLLSQKAVLYKGQTKFLVCAKKTQEETIVWNTTLANGNVLEGLDVDEDIVQQNDDVIEQILLKLEQIEASGGSYTLPIATPTQLGGVKPVAKTDEMTQEVGVDEAGGLFTKEGDGIDEETLNQINRNTEDISKLSDEKANKTYVDEQIAKAQLEGAGVDTSQFVTQSDLKNINTGLTTAQVNALNEMFKVCAYTQSDVSTQYNAFKTAFGIGGNEEPEEPDTPITPTVTLSSITATYNGGEVLVGTDVDDLTGITVTGAYSDGTTKNIIDYTLSGTIQEGNNTITVSYQGKTTTFTVVGYVEQVEPTAPVYKLAQATTLDGTSGIDSGYILNDVDKDFSILIEYEPTSDGGYIFDATKNANLFGPFFINSGINNMKVGSPNNTIDYVGGTTKTKFIMTHEKESGVFNTFLINTSLNYINTKEIVSESYATNQHTVGNTNPLKIGAKYNDTSFFKGTIHQFEIHERVITDEEIEAFMQPTWVEPSEPINLIDLSTCKLGGTMDDGRSISTDFYITDYIPITYGNPYITNLSNDVDGSTSVAQYIYLYDSNKTRLALSQLDSGVPMGTYWDIRKLKFKNNPNCSYVRIVFHKNYETTGFFGEGLV